MDRWRNLAPEAGVTLAAIALFSWRVGSASPWWDEAITREVTARPFADIVRLTTHIDLVHLAYYAIVHALTDGSGITAIRMVSVVAAAITAGLLVRIGRELGQLAVGVCAGLLYTVAPLASRYAQEARSYALVTAAATAATVVLLRALRRPWRRRGWVAYSGLLVLTGLLNLLALTLVLAHLVYVHSEAPQPVRRRWRLATAAALACLLPLMIAASRQRDQVDWLPRPRPSALVGFFTAQYAAWLIVALLVALAVVGLRPSTSSQPATHRQALLLGVSWAVVPPVALWIFSQLDPMFDWRYVVFCLPGTALAIASLATLLRPSGAAVLVVALTIGGWHMQHVYRRPATGHAEDVRGAAGLIEAGARPGDAVVFLPSSRRIVELAYPEDFRNVEDVALQVDPTTSATLWGVEGDPAFLAAALRTHDRVWVVTGPPRLGEEPTTIEQEKMRMLGGGYRLAQVGEAVRYDVLLYLRDPPERASGRTPVSRGTA